MKRWIHAKEDISASASFDRWYDSLSSKEQDKVDDLADEMGLPLYDECSDAELAQLHDCFVSAKTAVTSDTIVDNGKIQPGLVYYSDGFTHKVTWVSKDHKTCKEEETWINEDTGKPMKKIHKCNIAQDENGNEFYYKPEYEEYAFNSNDPDGYSWWARTYAKGADNYPLTLYGDKDYFEDLEEEDEDEEYTSSASRGDYSPSNPWDAPGMSMSDFI